MINAAEIKIHTHKTMDKGPAKLDVIKLAFHVDCVPLEYS